MCSSIHGTQQTSSSSPKDSGGGGGTLTSNGTLSNRSTITSSEESLLMAESTSSSPIITRFKSLISKRSRTIYVLYIVAFLDLLAVSLFLPLINAEIRALGASHFMTGLIGSSFGFLQLFSSPVMGRESDKYGPKPVLVICLLTTAVGYIIQGCAVTMAFMLVARTIAGIFKHTQTIGKSIVSELSPKDKSYVIGNFNAFGSMGFILGPTLGAHIYETEHGFRTICCLSAAAFALNAVLILLLVPDPSRLTVPSPQNSATTTSSKTKKRRESDPTPESGSGGSSGYAVKSTDIHTVLLLIVRFLFGFATLVFRETLGYVLKVKYNNEVVDTGYLTSLQAMMSTVVGFTVGPISAFVYKGNSLYMVLVTGIMKTIALSTLFYSTSYSLAAAMLITISALNPFLRVGITAVSLEGHDNEIGTVLGLSQSATSMARMLSPAVAGFAVGYSNDGPFLVGAIAAACGIIATLIAQRFTCPKDGQAQSSKEHEKKE